MAAAPTSDLPPRGGGLYGALALLADTADEVVLSTVRDVHVAVAKRVYGVTGVATAGSTKVSQRIHKGVSTAIYGGLGTGLRAGGERLRQADRRSSGPRIEDTARGRFLVSAINGIIGDRLAEEQSGLAIELAVRRDGRDVPLDPGSMSEAFPTATSDVVVFLHGLSESESFWEKGAREGHASYGTRLSEDTSWTPVYLRANTGLPIAENGVALASLLDSLVASWPTEVRRIALVGHSMGGLIMRSACAVVTDAPSRNQTSWTNLVSDVVTLGTPHLGAPIERGLALGVKALGRLPEAAPFGRILEYRSVGILDLRAGLAADVQNLPHARYHLVAATLASSPRHPVSETLGDLLVRYPSAIGRPRRGREMFPGADVLHVKGDHFDLLNHPEVYTALKGWLS
jgi:pimeloyl-ACP methyl ester carboxylesterase